MLTLNNINVTFDDKYNAQNLILNNLNLIVKPGEFVVIIGSNGAGKSTLFNTISGFITPHSGTIILDQKDITATGQTERCKLIASVMQDPRSGTIEEMTIYDNLAFVMKRGHRRHLLPFKKKQYRDIFCDHLKILNMGFENRLDEKVMNFSGGQRQALSLIMATMADSKILLLDEITAALDPSMAEIIMKLTDTVVRSTHKSCIMITHNMDQAVKYGDRIILLKQGNFIKEFSKITHTNITLNTLIQSF